MQGYHILAAEPRGLPPGKILPQYLKDLGYVTRAIGKWHLGYYKKEVTPTFRGFDSYLGHWNGHVSYYDYLLHEHVRNYSTSYIQILSIKYLLFIAIVLNKTVIRNSILGKERGTPKK